MGYLSRQSVLRRPRAGTLLLYMFNVDLHHTLLGTSRSFLENPVRTLLGRKPYVPEVPYVPYVPQVPQVPDVFGGATKKRPTLATGPKQGPNKGMLLRTATEYGIVGRSRMNKSDLTKALTPPPRLY